MTARRMLGFSVLRDPKRCLLLCSTHSQQNNAVVLFLSVCLFFLSPSQIPTPVSPQKKNEDRSTNAKSWSIVHSRSDTQVHPQHPLSAPSDAQTKVQNCSWRWRKERPRNYWRCSGLYPVFKEPLWLNWRLSSAVGLDWYLCGQCAPVPANQ